MNIYCDFEADLRVDLNGVVNVIANLRRQNEDVLSVDAKGISAFDEPVLRGLALDHANERSTPILLRLCWN